MRPPEPVTLNGLLSEEQREQAETFSERHTEDRLNEDLARSAGVAADGLNGLGADHTDGDSSGDEAGRGSDVTRNADRCGLSDEVDHCIT